MVSFSKLEKTSFLVLELKLKKVEKRDSIKEIVKFIANILLIFYWYLILIYLFIKTFLNKNKLKTK